MPQDLHRGAASMQHKDTPNASWEDLRAFLLCTRHQSFRNAAEVLGLTGTTLIVSWCHVQVPRIDVAADAVGQNTPTAIAHANSTPRIRSTRGLDPKRKTSSSQMNRVTPAIGVLVFRGSGRGRRRHRTRCGHPLPVASETIEQEAAWRVWERDM